MSVSPKNMIYGCVIRPSYENSQQPIAGNDGLNYTSNYYRINDWYYSWLPDRAHIDQRHDSKTVYDVRVR